VSRLQAQLQVGRFGRQPVEQRIRHNSTVSSHQGRLPATTRRRPPARREPVVIGPTQQRRRRLKSPLRRAPARPSVRPSPVFLYSSCINIGGGGGAAAAASTDRPIDWTGRRASGGLRAAATAAIRAPDERHPFRACDLSLAGRCFIWTATAAREAEPSRAEPGRRCPARMDWTGRSRPARSASDTTHSSSRTRRAPAVHY